MCRRLCLSLERCLDLLVTAALHSNISYMVEEGDELLEAGDKIHLEVVNDINTWGINLIVNAGPTYMAPLQHQ